MSMEPVAWMDDGTTRNGSETTSFRVVHTDTKATMPRASSENFTVPLVRLSDAEARIAELETRLKYAYGAKHRCNEDANHERQQAITAEARAEAAEALLKEAVDVIKPFAEYFDGKLDCDNLGWPLPDHDAVGWIYLKHMHFRAARSLAAKIKDAKG